MVDFTGWSLPIRYGSILEEHEQVRTSGGFFDVSHMGRLRFRGKDAVRCLDRICTRQIQGMAPGLCRYSLVCNEQGGCRDDVLVYCMGPDEYLMVCNGANRAKIIEHVEANRAPYDFKFDDQTEKTAMCAVQGPKVMDLIGSFSKEIPNLKRFRFVTKNLMVLKAIISRTGYTGEDGVEVILDAKMAAPALKMLLKDLGEDDSIIKPCGLGARDTLRMEAGMPLYGHELGEDIDPLSAGLGFAVKLDKGENVAEGDPPVERFIGQEALQAIAAKGSARTLVGLFVEGRRAARQGMPIMIGDQVVGEVTSGCVSPTLERSIAMGFVDTPRSEPGTGVEIDLGRTRVAAETRPLPLYKRAR
jgi:aminomethyltransferase